MATYSKTVDPNGGSDYASLNAWEAGEQALYASGDVAIADCKRTGATKDTAILNVAGWTAGVIPRIIVNSAHRHEGKWADQQVGENYIYVIRSVSATAIITYSHPCVGGLIYGLLVECPGTGGYFNSGGIFYTCGGVVADLTVDSCIIKNTQLPTATTTAPKGVTGTGVSTSILYVRNSVVHDFKRDTGGGFGLSASYCPSLFHNNTVSGCNTGIATSSPSTTHCKNNIAVNCVTDYSGLTSNANNDYNVSSDATAPGTNKVTGKTAYTDYFVDPANGDFHLKNTSLNLFGLSGTDLSGTFTTDIDGVTRSAPWDIGADQYVAAGGTIYTETLTDLITSQTSITDRQDYLETASVLIQSGVSAADVQTMLEAVLILVASSTSVTDTLVQPNSISEILLVTATAVTMASDAQIFVEAVTTTAQAATSLSDLRLMLDNVSILCQSQVSAVEIQNYMQSIIVTASATGSLTDVLVGAFVGKYLFTNLCHPRSFQNQARPRLFASICKPRRFTDQCHPRGNQ